MNNTKTRTLTIVAVLMAATLVVGTFAVTTTVTTQTAFAYSKKDNKKDGSGGNDNGNTITIQKCKQAAAQSGFDNNQGQECENLICTHQGENATCVQEGAAAAQAQVNKTQPVTLTCEQCFAKFLSADQIFLLTRGMPLTDICERLSGSGQVEVQLILERITGSESLAAQIIQCLKDAGVQFLRG
jgi:hypothetical protein